MWLVEKMAQVRSPCPSPHRWTRSGLRPPLIPWCGLDPDRAEVAKGEPVLGPWRPASAVRGSWSVADLQLHLCLY